MLKQKRATSIALFCCSHTQLVHKCCIFRLHMLHLTYEWKFQKQNKGVERKTLPWAKSEDSKRWARVATRGTFLCVFEQDRSRNTTVTRFSQKNKGCVQAHW